MLPPLTHPSIYGFETEVKHYYEVPKMRFRFNACRIAGYIPIIALIKNIFAAFYFNIPGFIYAQKNQCRALWMTTMTAYDAFLKESNKNFDVLEMEEETWNSECEKHIFELNNHSDYLDKKNDKILIRLKKDNLNFNTLKTPKISSDELAHKFSQKYGKIKQIRNAIEDKFSDTTTKEVSSTKLTKKELDIVETHLQNERSKSISENYRILRKKRKDLYYNRESKSAEYDGKIKEIEQRESTLLSREIHDLMRFIFENAGLGIFYIIPDFANTYWKPSSAYVTPVNEIT